MIRALVVLSLLALVSANFKATQQAMARFKSQQYAALGRSLGPGEYQFSVSRPEGERQFWVHIPQSYSGSTPVPLLFAFHGLGDECYSFMHNTGFIDISEKNGFILVSPCGTNGLIGTAWNAGTCCLNPSTIDDVAFTRAMIANVSATWNINSERIFSSGFSNGAMMTERLACEMSDLLLGAAGVSGCVVLDPGNDDGERNCDAIYGTRGKAISVLHIHGNDDWVVPWTGDAILGFPPTPTDFADWSNRNKCQGQPVQTLNSGPYTNQIYQSCANSTKMELVLHNGGGHEWPVDQYFNTPQYIWNWFSKL